jgi:hypothetical protein
VNARAKRVHHEYYQKHAKAIEIDAKYNNTMEGIVGPVQRVVQSFGRTRGFVVGAYGECSQDPLKLVDDTAAAQGVKDWRRMGCKGAVEATGVLVEATRTNISLTGLYSHARLLLDRMIACNAEVLQEPNGKIYDGLYIIPSPWANSARIWKAPP